MKLTLNQVRKNFGDTQVVKGVDLTIEHGELFFLLGPSGCGKTTILRMVAGFGDPDSGDILFGDKKVNQLPAHQRNTGMVFQSYALFPHMSVFDNVAYGLRLRKRPEDEIKKKVAQGLEMVRMSHLIDRMPNQLSGGQQQRVALARAVVINPDILLLDEPLSNLDALLRIELRDEIRRILRETGNTALYVTHDQEEAISLADRIGVMQGGVLLQVAPPRVIYRHPVHKFVAEFLGEMNWIEGRVKGQPANGIAEVETKEGTFHADVSGHLPARPRGLAGDSP
ncbi:ABC transporter ATP-binding protein [Kamptonema cortianum]|nr:ABC transporter ATP-binding protein [Kamptonema cortianum]